MLMPPVVGYGYFLESPIGMKALFVATVEIVMTFLH